MYPSSKKLAALSDGKVKLPIPAKYFWKIGKSHCISQECGDGEKCAGRPKIQLTVSKCGGSYALSVSISSDYVQHFFISSIRLLTLQKLCVWADMHSIIQSADFFYLNSPPWTSKEYDILKIRPTNVTPNFLFLIFIPFRETYGDEMSFIIHENTTNWYQRLQRCSQVISFNFCFDIVCVKHCSVFCCGFKMTEYVIRVVKKKSFEIALKTALTLLVAHF